MEDSSQASEPDHGDGHEPVPDSFITGEDGKKYWESIDATDDGMLGGFEHLTKLDLQGSRSFLAKLGIGHKNGCQPVKNVLEGGAGIGRVTKGLLVDLSTYVDVVEPIVKFTDKLRSYQGVRHIFSTGLEAWTPVDGIQYDLIWVQWCVGHLNDAQMIEFVQKCQTVLVPENGLIVFKENLSSGRDVFDPEDDSVTREDSKFRSLFSQAGMSIVRTELQKGFPTSLFPVRMYALRPKKATS